MKISILLLIALITVSCGPKCLKGHDVVTHTYHSDEGSNTNHWVHDEYRTIFVCDAWEVR